jgi:hypothetical protein
MIEGRVEQVNERGIFVAGEWRNVSRFKPITLPTQGSQVRVETDPKGFIAMLEVLDAAPPRNATITRLAVLKAAALFGASRPDLKSADVLAIASKWLAWVEQSAADE